MRRRRLSLTGEDHSLFDWPDFQNRAVSAITKAIEARLLNWRRFVDFG
jgi:hypothetical protein